MMQTQSIPQLLWYVFIMIAANEKIDSETFCLQNTWSNIWPLIVNKCWITNWAMTTNIQIRVLWCYVQQLCYNYCPLKRFFCGRTIVASNLLQTSLWSCTFYFNVFHSEHFFFCYYSWLQSKHDYNLKPF